MGMTTDGLSYWQAESEGIELLDTTIGDLLYESAFVTLFVTISRCFAGTLVFSKSSMPVSRG